MQPLRLTRSEILQSPLRLEKAHRRSSSSSTVRPAWRRMSDRVPLSSVWRCGTTVRESLSGVYIPVKRGSLGRPSFQVKLNCFAEICPRGLDVFALRCDIQFGAARHVRVIFLRNARGEAVVHAQMLTDASRGSKPSG